MNGFRSLRYVMHYLSAYGATPPEGCPIQRPTLQGSQTRVKLGKALLRQRFFFDPFRVGETRLTASGGVAPGYYLLPLQGTENRIFSQVLTPDSCSANLNFRR